MEPSVTPVHASFKQVVVLPRCDRWQVYYRLQELDICCDCLSDGSLQVEINSPVAALQLRSVVQHITESRQQLAERLEYCWKIS